MIWHVAYWVGRAADVLALAAEGPPYPDEPEDPSYYDAENDRAFAAGRQMTWASILEYLAEAPGRARGVIEGCEDRDRSWIHERYEEEIEHYREHGAQLQAFAP